MAISDEEALAWAEERQGDGRIPPPDGARAEALAAPPAPTIEGMTGAAPAPAAAPAPPNAAAPTPNATTGPARRELTVVLTLLPGQGDDTSLRACYSVGAEGAPYPVMSTLAVADAALAAAQIPARIAEAEARWLAQPSLPRATNGAAVVRPAPAATRPANGKTAATAKEQTKGQGAANRGDAVRLAAALLRDTTAAVGPVPTAPVAPTTAAVPDTVPPTIEPQMPPPPIPTKHPATAARGDQLSLFG